MQNLFTGLYIATSSSCSICEVLDSRWASQLTPSELPQRVVARCELCPTTTTGSVCNIRFHSVMQDMSEQGMKILHPLECSISLCGPWHLTWDWLLCHCVNFLRTTATEAQSGMIILIITGDSEKLSHMLFGLGNSKPLHSIHLDCFRCTIPLSVTYQS